MTRHQDDSSARLPGGPLSGPAANYTGGTTRLSRRAPLRRGKPLERRTPLRAQPRRTEGLNPAPAARKRRRPDIPRSSRRTVKARSGGWCEARIAAAAYSGRAHHMHHRQSRRFGDHSPGNLLHVCWRCHRWIHDHVAWALQRGLLVGGPQ